MDSLIKIIAMLNKRIEEIMEPVGAGLLGGLSFWFIKEYPRFIPLLLLIFILLLWIGYLLRIRFTKKCPYCGKFLKKNHYSTPVK